MTPVLIVTGTVGSGKTAVASEASEILERAGMAHAWVDLDALSQCYPRPADDRFHSRLMTRNLACVWGNCAGAGAKRLVLSGVIENASDLARIASAVPEAEPVVVRLRTPPDLVEERLRARHATVSGLAWHLARSPELESVMDDARLPGGVVVNDERSVEEVAAEVLRVAGWQP